MLFQHGLPAGGGLPFPHAYRAELEIASIHVASIIIPWQTPQRGRSADTLPGCPIDGTSIEHIQTFLSPADMNISSPLQYRCQVPCARPVYLRDRFICRVIDQHPQRILSLHHQDCQAPVTVVSCMSACLLPLPCAHEPALHLREQLGSLAPRAELIEIQVTVTDVLDRACQPGQLGDAALPRPLLVAPGACHENRLQRLCDKRRESIATANVSSVTSSRRTRNKIK
jgi:hypothetical protein